MYRLVTLVLIVAGCGGAFPPADISGASGALDAGDPACTIYPGDGYASIDLDFSGTLYVTFSGPANVWMRGTVGYSQLDDLGCAYPGGAAGTRVQYGDPINDPTCDLCSSRYRPLFLGEMSFAGGPACATSSFGCLTTDCTDVAPVSADSIAMWCDSPNDVTP